MGLRRLPPLTSLRAFEAAARHRSFSRAAGELCVTQGAVSRQVAKLENDLGVKLFLRRGRMLSLTAEGDRFHAYIREAFSKIAEGVDLFARQPSETVLKVKVPPSSISTSLRAIRLSAKPPFLRCAPAWPKPNFTQASDRAALRTERSFTAPNRRLVSMSN